MVTGMVLRLRGGKKGELQDEMEDKYRFRACYTLCQDMTPPNSELFFETGSLVLIKVLKRMSTHGHPQSAASFSLDQLFPEAKDQAV